MTGVAYKDFSDLIAAGERIEFLERSGKLLVNDAEGGASRKGFQPKNKEVEANYVQHRQNARPWYQTPYNPNFHIPHQIRTPPYPHPRNQINNVLTPQPFNPTHSIYARYPPAPQQNCLSYPRPRPNFQKQGRPHIPNLPPFPKSSISNAELFQQLFDQHLIAGEPVHPIEPPFPTWFNLNLTCKYHLDIPGHSIEDCEAFKKVVRK